MLSCSETTHSHILMNSSSECIIWPCYKGSKSEEHTNAQQHIATSRQWGNLVFKLYSFNPHHSSVVFSLSFTHTQFLNLIMPVSKVEGKSGVLMMTSIFWNLCFLHSYLCSGSVSGFESQVCFFFFFSFFVLHTYKIGLCPCLMISEGPDDHVT